MNNIEMQIIDSRLHDFGIPDYATEGAAGIDLRAMLEVGQYALIHPGETRLIPTGIAVNMNENMAAVILPRSGLGHKNGIVLGNLIGLVDEDYKKQIFVSCWNRNHDGAPFRIDLGDRIAQLVFLPVIKPNIKFVDIIYENGRGGFGHSGIS